MRLREFEKRAGAGVTRSFAQDVVGEEETIGIARALWISKVVEDAVESIKVRLKSRPWRAMRLTTGIADDCERCFWWRLGRGQANAKDLN